MELQFVFSIFPSREEAQAFRDVYFERYHSTAKALTAAENDGELPPLPEGVSLPPGREKRFIPDELDEHWAANLNFDMLGGVDRRRVDALQALKDNGLHLVAFPYPLPPGRTRQRLATSLCIALLYPRTRCCYERA